jgi:membrane fusion protein (multidrug efflux system)
MNIAAINIETAKRTLPPEDLPPHVAGMADKSATPGGRRISLRRFLPVVLVAAVVCGGAYSGWEYWTRWRFEVSTDDAYVQADVVTIAPQVAGNIASLLVGDNEHVKAGQVLAVIDQRDYQAAVDQANAGVAQAQAAIATNDAQLAQQQAVISEAQAAIEADQAAEVFAAQNNERYGKLASDGFGSVQNAQQAASQVASTKAVVTKDQAGLDAAQKQIATLAAELVQAKATLVQKQAMLEQAQINLGYTTIASPVDGVVGDRTLRVGQYVQPGTQLLAVVPLAKTYVVANYKETQLADVRPGQHVALAVDTFSGAAVRGFVDSIAPASGQEFALLPPDNATGNFTKIVQRIPVKITIDPSDPLAGMLRPGMSVTATIGIRSTPSAGQQTP